MQAEQARAILAQAKSTESYEGPIPEDDSKAVSEAENLVEMARVAWQQNVQGPEVEAILRLAEGDFDGHELPQNGNGHGLEQPLEASDNTDERIDKMVEEEPWEGYDGDRDKSIRELLMAGMEGEKDPRDLLAHVWAYESANKGRTRILNLVEELRQKLDDEPESTHATPDDPPVPPAEETPAADADEAHSNGGRDSEPEPEVARATDHGQSGSDGQPEAEVPQADISGSETDAAGGGALGGSDDDSQSEGQEDFTYPDLVAEVEEELRRNRLHVPEPPTEEAPRLPYDYSKLTDSELQSLHTVFSSYAYRASYLLMLHERAAMIAKMHADELHRELLVSIAKYDDKGKERKITVLEAEIESTPLIKRLRRDQRKHEIFAAAHRQERDSYNKLVESMSRLETMRQNEHERSRR